MDDLVILTPAQVAEHIPTITALTLQNWRAARKGPPFHYIGRNVVYYWNEVQDWLKSLETYI